jgi:major membrane immunogen (membrane-anchored lipoprotein)
MKQLLNLLLLASLIQLSSCKKDDNNSPSIGSTLQTGTWKVSYFNDSGNDETNDFTNYTFQFSSNGVVTATINSSSNTGTWSNSNDDSQDKLNLLFSAVPLDELNSDWHILEQNSNTIKLEDVSGGNGGTDYLTFSKN